MWFIGVEVEQEMSAPPPKNNAGSAPASHQSHYCLYYNGIPEFVRKRSMLTEKYLKQRKVLEISLSDSRIHRKWQTSAIIWEI